MKHSVSMDVFAHIDAIDRTMDSIVRDRRSGALELARRGIRVFLHAAPSRRAPVAAYVQEVEQLGRRLGDVRPSMAPVGAAAARVTRDFHGRARGARCVDEAYAALRDAVRRHEASIRATVSRVARRFASTFPSMRRPIVISYSSQVIAALEALPPDTVELVVCESRPRFEGRRTARRLASHARSVTLITEAQIGAAAGRCDGALLGSDAVSAGGSAVNKMGSYLVALASKAQGKPVVVLGDRLKLTRRTGGPGEAHPAGEVWKHPAPRVRVENRYFESVPAALIDFIVLDVGIFRPGELGSVWRAECEARGETRS